MLSSTIIMGVLAAALLTLAWHRGQLGEGLAAAGSLTWSILPMLVLAFLVAGLVQVLVPQELIAKWMGQESGFRGILIASGLGALTPGGPFVSLPLVLALFKGGAGIGPVVAFLTGWALWGVNRLPMELGILGWRITLIRLTSTLLLPPLAGLIARTLFGNTV